VRVIDPITATERFNLSGLGLGLRVKGPQGLSVSLDWARALKDVGTTPTRGESHLYFKLGYDW
jgi:hemolysin activation/secretion protein